MLNQAKGKQAGENVRKETELGVTSLLRRKQEAVRGRARARGCSGSARVQHPAPGTLRGSIAPSWDSACCSQGGTAGLGREAQCLQICLGEHLIISRWVTERHRDALGGGLVFRMLPRGSD